MSKRSSIIGCYALDLYCVCCTAVEAKYGADGREPSGAPAQYFGRTFSECKRKAVRDGWKFRKYEDYTVAVCEHCAKERRKVGEPHGE